MGKQPLASLIGACAVGMLLTGCNCCKPGTRASFAQGKADRGMGLTHNTRNRNVSTGPITQGAPLNSSTSFTPAATGYGSGSLGTNGTTSNTPGYGTGTMPSMGGNAALPANTPSATSLGANTPSGGNQTGLMGSAAAPSMTASGSGSSRMSLPQIQQTSYQTSEFPPVKNAPSSSSAFGAASASPTKNAAGAIKLPSPSKTTNLSPEQFSSPAKSTMSSGISSPPPPPPPPSIGKDPYSNPPPKVKSGPSSSVPGLGATKSSTSSGSASKVLRYPSYLNPKE